MINTYIMQQDTQSRFNSNIHVIINISIHNNISNDSPGPSADGVEEHGHQSSSPSSPVDFWSCMSLVRYADRRI